jgi:predicted short-subunit dehydrogenase-like oxidoreductase (DUF2520 family)
LPTRAAVASLEKAEPATVLTGPVVRGDIGTLERHAQLLKGPLRELAPLYAATGRRLVRLALGAGRLTPARARAGRGLLDSLPR